MLRPKEETARLQHLERENQRLRRSVEELSLLNELAREIGASLEADEIMSKIVRRALKSVQAEQGVITLVEERHEDQAVTLVRAARSSVEQDVFHLNDSLLGWMHHYKKPLRLNDPAQDARFRDARWDPSIRSLLSAPLLIRSRLTGMLTVYNKRTSSGFTDEDQRLLSIIASQSAQIIENARLYEEEKALVGMREEMRLAFEIQTSLLPKEPPVVPGYEVAAASTPAQTVGGDYFDYIPLDSGLLGLCVGDVSGKGLPASLLMANVQATLRGQAPWSESAGVCLERANKLLCQSIRKGTFVTLCYGMLDAARYTLHYANAGHNRPLLRTADGVVKRLDLGGLALGFLSNATYEDAALTFAPGDLLLIYSDGITEAMNPAREQFEEERLVALLQQHGHGSAQALVDQVGEAVQRHAGTAPQGDDITLMAVRRLG